MIQFKQYTLEQALLQVAGDEAKAAYKQDTDGTYAVGIACYDDFYAIESVETKAEANALKEEYTAALQADNAAPARFYTLDELLPKLSGEARAYCETVADTYVCGVEQAGESYAMMTFADAQDADSFVAELNRSLDEHFAPVKTEVVFDGDEAAMLDGFTFVPNKGLTSIFVGKRNRLYLKGDITTTLGIKPRQRVLIAFRPADKAFAIVKPNSPAVTEQMRQAGYFVSGRKDVTAAALFREFDLDKYEGETFYADTASLSGNVVIFRR